MSEFSTVNLTRTSPFYTNSSSILVLYAYYISHKPSNFHESNFIMRFWSTANESAVRNSTNLILFSNIYSNILYKRTKEIKLLCFRFRTYSYSTYASIVEEEISQFRCARYKLELFIRKRKKYTNSREKGSFFSQHRRKYLERTSPIS